ncbi:hypothetical protein ACIRRT_09665 [Streptomyces sp. NPDC102256]|uniref:hypothetical protein n=1 Tax=Streptomyces sp. NPDC102256 TaxID=3366147 RepID=UPI0037F69D61
MRRTVALATVATALAGSLAGFGGQAMAVSNGTAPRVSQAAGCVTVVRWYNKRFNRMVEVKNSCARTACFSVTVAARRDPDLSIGKNKKESFAYGGVAWTKGSGIKNKAC